MFLTTIRQDFDENTHDSKEIVCLRFQLFDIFKYVQNVHKVEKHDNRAESFFNVQDKGEENIQRISITFRLYTMGVFVSCAVCLVICRFFFSYCIFPFPFFSIFCFSLFSFPLPASPLDRSRS